MRLMWLRKLIGCRCLEKDWKTTPTKYDALTGSIIVMTDEQIAELEERERLERLFQET